MRKAAGNTAMKMYEARMPKLIDNVLITDKGARAWNWLNGFRKNEDRLQGTLMVVISLIRTKGIMTPRPRPKLLRPLPQASKANAWLKR